MHLDLSKLNELYQKILIIRFSSIGDIVLSTSALRTIKLLILSTDNFSDIR
ncbi:hypothetical protein Ct9H90mP29_05130 [bacterium]|nr:MAG: hypothetical protein Ct9H90mP29_05130 [bacterium]